MNRKEFIEKLVGIGAVLGAGALALSTVRTKRARAASRAEAMSGFRAKRHATDWASEIEAAPEQVFPLLCPVRELEWLEGWSAEIVYSDSGVAEENCIFKTNFRGATAIWTVSRYEPPKRIEFVIVTPDVEVGRLSISLEPTAKGTRLRWQRIFTGLSEKRNETIDSWKTETDQALSEKIEYFIKHGTMRVGG
jgi:hypothetical protein